MGFIKSIFRKRHHLLKQIICFLLCKTLFYHCSRNSSLGISMNKGFLFLCKDIHFFLTHGTSYKVCSSKTISGHLLEDLHDLFLINGTMICRFQNLIQIGILNGNGMFRFFSLFSSLLPPFLSYDLRNVIHRTGSIGRYQQNNVFKTFRLEFL